MEGRGGAAFEAFAPCCKCAMVRIMMIFIDPPDVMTIFISSDRSSYSDDVLLLCSHLFRFWGSMPLYIVFEIWGIYAIIFISVSLCLSLQIDVDWCWLILIDADWSFSGNFFSVLILFQYFAAVRSKSALWWVTSQFPAGWKAFLRGDNLKSYPTHDSLLFVQCQNKKIEIMLLITRYYFLKMCPNQNPQCSRQWPWPRPPWGESRVQIGPAPTSAHTLHTLSTCCLWYLLPFNTLLI